MKHRLSLLGAAWTRSSAANRPRRPGFPSTRGYSRPRQISADELARGQDRGPLHGIPLGIKDIVDVAGQPTRAGSTITDARPAASDATVVARLRGGGAGARQDRDHRVRLLRPRADLEPLERGPHAGRLVERLGRGRGFGHVLWRDRFANRRLNHPPGQLLRRRRREADHGPRQPRGCGAGQLPSRSRRCHGPHGCRLRATVGGDCRRRPARPGRALRGELVFAPDRTTGPLPPRLGVLRRYFFDGADSETAELTDLALERLRAAGATLVDVALPEGFERVHAMHRRIMASEAAQYHRARYGAPRGYGPNMAALIDEGLAVSIGDYQEALQHQRAFSHAGERSLAGVDALVTPATPGPAPRGPRRATRVSILPGAMPACRPCRYRSR